MDGAWLTKGTDCPIVYNCIELAGKSRCKYIETVLYNYIEHDQNSYKTVKNEFRAKQLQYLTSLPPLQVIDEDIHIVMCCWKRTENLEIQVKNLNEQTIAKRIHLHLINNNVDTVDTLNSMVPDLSQKYTNIKLSVTHYQNKYFGFQRFFYIRDNLIKQYNIDYVIIIDDDQIFKNNWVEKMYEKRQPQTHIAWYGKKWVPDSINYWKDSIVTYGDCYRNTKENCKEFHYGGTGGMIIDVSIFNSTSKLWDIPTDLPSNTTVYNIEDLWLSFIERKVYGWTIQRSFLPETGALIKNTSDPNSLYLSLHTQKQNLLNYLICKYGL
jgi:hypothetical protein